MGYNMKKLILFTIASTLSFGAFALPQPKASCSTTDLQARYARLYAAGSMCGKDENSQYAKKMSYLFEKDQSNCNVSSEDIDPTDEQIDQAFKEIQNFPKGQQQSLCKTIDSQINSLTQ